jgi:capsular polysaccharide biosynthesis protein
MKQKSKLPLNISDEYYSLFKKNESYYLPDLKLRILKNVFVSHAGIVLRGKLIPMKSAENLVGFYDYTFYWSHWRKAIEQYLVCKFGRSLPFIKLRRTHTYFTIHTPWFGYFSWLTTNIPKLLSVVEKHSDAILLVPEEWDNIPFVKDSLKLFPKVKIQVFPKDNHAFVEKFILAENRPWTSVFYPEQIQQVRDFYFSQISELVISPVKRLYISRKKANRRRIENESVLTDYLKMKGFEVICFEDYSIIEQAFLANNAEYIVSMHGAGLTNVLFMSPGASVLEITPIVDKEDQFRFPFWRISSILNLRYYVQFSNTVQNGETDVYSRNIVVDTDQFIKNIDLMLNKMN